MNAVDLFAGPGGWSVACQRLGIDELGIEWDAAACATREAAGHRTLQADVSKLDPADFPCDLLIASPPCQDFSMAGKRAGIGGDRGQLLAEVMRWATALHPMFVACEQVPPVLPYWKDYAHRLRAMGYSAWCGVLNSADYGVPQTRERAILIARRDGLPALPPEPTHCKGGAPESMFSPGLLPWVSMADALGWAGTDALEHPRGKGMTERYGERAPKPADREAMTVTSKARSWVLRTGDPATRPNQTQRPLDEPAPTLAFGHDAASHQWTRKRPSPTVVTTRRSRDGLVIGRQLPAGESVAVGGWDGSAADDRATGVRVTVQEAAVLQSFDPDYPWQGSRTKQFECIGNAIPPLLAENILRTFPVAAERAA